MGYYPYYGVEPNNSTFSLFPKVNLNSAERSVTYYYPYYPPYWGGGYTQTYKTGTVVLEMGEGQSVRDYWNWYNEKTKDEIDNTLPEELPKIRYLWHAFIESILSGDDSYDKSRIERGFNEAFEQSYYLNK